MKGFLIILFFVGGIIAYFVMQPYLPHDTPAPVNLKDPYLGMRVVALETTAPELGINYTNDSMRVYGMAMEWLVNGGATTLVSYTNGDAALYFEGGGKLVPGEYENVKEAAREFVLNGDSLVRLAMPVMGAPMPNKDTVNFWFLTTGGRLLVQEARRNFSDTTLQWGPLFMKGNEVMNELRTVETLNALDAGNK